MPRGLFRRGEHKSGHSHHGEKEADKVPFEEYAELQQEINDLREQLDDASENLQLAKLSARTLEDHYRSEISDAAELRSSFAASEAQVSKLESHVRAGQSGTSEQSSALAAQEARVAELETQKAAAEERHKAVVSKLAAEAMSKASGADEAQARLVQVEQSLAEAQADAAELRKSLAARSCTEDGESQKLRSELSAAKDREEQQHRQHAELRTELATAEEEAGAQTSAATSALADSLLTLSEVDSLRSELSEIRIAKDDESELVQHLRKEMNDLQGRIAQQDEAHAVLEAKLQLVEAEQQQEEGAQSTNHSPKTLIGRSPRTSKGRSPRTPKTPKGDAVAESTELARLKLELAESNASVVSLQTKLDAAAEEGLRLIDANTAIEEHLQEVKDKNTELQERLDTAASCADAEVQCATALRDELAASQKSCEALRDEARDAGDFAAMKQSTERAVEHSESLLVEVSTYQAECETLRKRAEEATDKSTLECLVEQATGRSAELLASLVASEATCDLLREEATTAQAASDASKSRADVLSMELANAEETSATSAVLREEFVEAEVRTAETAAELKEELAKECAGHSAAAAAADDALAAHAALRSEVAIAESAVEDSETWANKLQAELTQERAGRESEIQKALVTGQAQHPGKVHFDEVEVLKGELSSERRHANAEVAALEAARAQQVADPERDSKSQDEIEELLSQVSDLQYALNITSEAAADLDDSGQPVGVREARRFRAECAQLESELQRSKASVVQLNAAISAREPRLTADFGPGSPAVSSRRTVTLPGDSPQGSQAANRRTRSSPSFASCPEEVQVTSFEGRADATNPFSDAGSQADGSSSRASSPPRASRGSDTSEFSFDPPERNGLPACGGTAEETGNPFGDAANPFDCDQAKAQFTSSAPTPSFEADGGRMSAAQAQAAAAAEVAHLRAALQTEEKACLEAKAACAEAREEAARGAKRALVAASGTDAGGEAGEVHELRRALSDEAAKSRRLCKQAIRAEESRRRLLQEMLTDSQVEVDVVQLAKLVGRAAKAIAVVSEAAPMQSAEQVPASGGINSTSVPSAPVVGSAPAPVLASPSPARNGAAQEESQPQGAATRATPSRVPCMPGLPSGPLASAVTPSRLPCGPLADAVTPSRLPGLPGPVMRSPRSSMPSNPFEESAANNPFAEAAASNPFADAAASNPFADAAASNPFADAAATNNPFADSTPGNPFDFT